MTCKTIERLILEGEDRALNERERQMVDDHLLSCPGCRAFGDGRRAAWEVLMDLRQAEPPQALDLRTRRLCREALGAAHAEAPETKGRAKVPLPVIAASVLFTVLAAIWLTAALADLTPGENLPTTAWLAIAFIAQNVLMLFLAPVILGAGRATNDDHIQSGQRI